MTSQIEKGLTQVAIERMAKEAGGESALTATGESKTESSPEVTEAMAEARSGILKTLVASFAGWSFRETASDFVSGLEQQGLAECYDSSFGLDYYQLTEAGKRLMLDAALCERSLVGCAHGRRCPVNGGQDLRRCVGNNARSNSR